MLRVLNSLVNPLQSNKRKQHIDLKAQTCYNAAMSTRSPESSSYRHIALPAAVALTAALALGACIAEDKPAAPATSSTPDTTPRATAPGEITTLESDQSEKLRSAEAATLKKSIRIAKNVLNDAKRPETHMENPSPDVLSNKGYMSQIDVFNIPAIQFLYSAKEDTVRVIDFGREPSSLNLPDKDAVDNGMILEFTVDPEYKQRGDMTADDFKVLLSSPATELNQVSVYPEADVNIQLYPSSGESSNYDFSKNGSTPEPVKAGQLALVDAALEQAFNAARQAMLPPPSHGDTPPPIAL